MKAKHNYFILTTLLFICSSIFSYAQDTLIIHKSYGLIEKVEKLDLPDIVIMHSYFLLSDYNVVKEFINKEHLIRATEMDYKYSKMLSTQFRNILTREIYSKLSKEDIALLDSAKFKSVFQRYIFYNNSHTLVSIRLIEEASNKIGKEKISQLLKALTEEKTPIYEKLKPNNYIIWNIKIPLVKND